MLRALSTLPICSPQGSNYEERKYLECTKKLLQDVPGLSVYGNFFLAKCIESDIVIHNKESGEYYNIEIDGSCHLRNKKKRFCDLRDAYLRDAANVKVARISTVTRTNMSTKLEVVRNLLLGWKLIPN